MSKLETNTIDTVSGTSTLQVGSTNTSTITLGVSGDTVNVPSGVTIANSGTATGFGGANTPAFSVKESTGLSIPNNSKTKLVFGTEIFDTDSAFASNKFTVPSGEAGKYFFTAQWQTATATDFDQLRIYFYKNASPLDGNTQIGNVHYTTTSLNQILDLSASDYVEVYAFQESGGTINSLGTAFFQGYKLIGA